MAQVIKIAHFVSHDEADLRRRFPALTIAGTAELGERIACLGLPSRALETMIASQFGMWLDKRIDHRLWSCGRLLDEHQVYAAADAWAVGRLAAAAREQQRRGSPRRQPAPQPPSDEEGGADASPPPAGSPAPPRVAVSRHSRRSPPARPRPSDVDSDDESIPDVEHADLTEDEEGGEEDDDPNGALPGALLKQVRAGSYLGHTCNS